MILYLVLKSINYLNVVMNIILIARLLGLEMEIVEGDIACGIGNDNGCDYRSA